MKRSHQRRAQRLGNAVLHPPAQKPRYGLRFGVLAAASFLFLWLLQHRLATLDLAAVSRAFAAVSALHWAAALAATALSFWAVGQYDAGLHRHLGTDTPPKQAHRAGMAAIALGQTLGLGVVTGALVRWRMLPGMTLLAATKLSAAVAVSFLFGWAMVTALVLIALPDAPFKPAAFALCGIGVLAAALCLMQPRLHLLGRQITLPNLFTLWQILAFSLVDTGAAAVAIWLLCPPDLALPFATLLPAYLLALGAGLLSGGVGAFEVTLLAALPTVPEPALIAGVLAFRLAYYAVPAILAAATVAGAALRRPRAAALTPLAPRAPNAPAEAGLAAQNQLVIHQFPQQMQALIGETPHSVTMLLSPFGPVHYASALRALQAHATTRARLPCLYKCNARLAATARAAGWHTAPIAAEAWLNPTTYTHDGADKSVLRRKLRKAAKANLALRPLTPADWPAMAQINQNWVQHNGAERGFSMGRFAPAHIATQRLFGAFAAGRLCAFISLHHTPQEWVLDLMRHDATMPDGTLYALVDHAVQAAAHARITRLSLAAAQRFPDLGPLLRRWIAPQHGLCQFKSAFAPVWQPLYIAAPNRAALLLAGAEIYRAIHAPPPLTSDGPHNLDEENKIASHGQPWHMVGN